MKIHVHILYECTIRKTIKIQEKSKFKLHMKKPFWMTWSGNFGFHLKQRVPPVVLMVHYFTKSRMMQV